LLQVSKRTKRYGKASSYIFATFLSESRKHLGAKGKKIVVSVYAKKAYRGSGGISTLILEWGECSRSVTASLPPGQNSGTHEQKTVRGFVASLDVLKTRKNICLCWDSKLASSSP
jgi:hypothetical protein